MRQFTATILFLTLCGPTSRAAPQIEILAGGEFQLHMQGSTSKDPHIPEKYQVVSQSPSINTFFDDGAGLSFCIRAGFALSESKRIHLGFSHSRVSLSNHFPGSEQYLGRHLLIQRFFPHVGIGKAAVGPSGLNAYAATGPSVRIYRGKETIQNIDIIASFNHSVGLGLQTGLGIPLWPPIGANLDCHVDLGTASRAEITFQENGKVLQSASPTGDIRMQDTAFGISFSLSYRYTDDKKAGQ